MVLTSTFLFYFQGFFFFFKLILKKCHNVFLKPSLAACLGETNRARNYLIKPSPYSVDFNFGVFLQRVNVASIFTSH